MDRDTHVTSLKVATYNIHKCVGLDRRMSVARVARVIEEIDPDVIALQEVVSETGFADTDHERDQAEALARRLGMRLVRGPAYETDHRAYGNVVLTRLPVVGHENYDISFRRREPRACMRVDVELPGGVLHFYNTHFGTSYFERCEQSHLLLRSEILKSSHPDCPQVLVGDFNDWFQGLPSRLLGDHLHDVTRKLKPTYPGVAPVFRLDRIYLNRHIVCRRVQPHLSLLSRIASDHVPIVAGVEIANGR